MTRRLPALQQILSVLALVAVPFYGWTIMVFFWKLPGWLYFLSVGEIATLLATGNFAARCHHSNLFSHICRATGWVCGSADKAAGFGGDDHGEFLNISNALLAIE